MIPIPLEDRQLNLTELAKIDTSKPAKDQMIVSEGKHQAVVVVTATGAISDTRGVSENPSQARRGGRGLWVTKKPT